MPSAQPAVGAQVFLAKSGIAPLIEELVGHGYTVLGPVHRNGVVTLRPVRTVKDLARGVRDEQAAGRYGLVEGDPELFFEFVVGPDGPKRFLFPPEQPLFRMHIEGASFALDSGPAQPPKLAFLGIRPCELAAISVQDRVFGFADSNASRCESEPGYVQAREAALLIAVNCTYPGGTCFCGSMGTGPEARSEFDLALTELRSGFVVRVGSSRGGEILSRLPIRAPSSTELELKELRMEQARGRMGRTLDVSDVRQMLERAVDHPRWDEVAKRCLGCGNCTMVCPTCFCSSINDASDLAGGGVARTRSWDCCYTLQFSYTTAGPLRSSIRARYRHWLRHKLCTWWDQFGMSGCVGCGRCITWCPVGIDLTEEVAAIRGRCEAAPRPGSEVAR